MDGLDPSIWILIKNGPGKKSDPSPSKIPGSETLLNGYSRALPLLLALNDITIQKHGTDIRW